MKEKEKIKLNITLIVVCVCVLSFSLLYASYGYFFKIDNDDNGEILSVEYLDKNNNTLSTHNEPMTFDSNGVKNTEVVYIQNSDPQNSKKITLTIANDEDSFKSRNDYKESDMLVPLEYINVIVYKFNEKNNQLNPVTDIIKLSNATIYSLKNGEVEYSLFTDILESSSGLNNANTYTIFMWLDENTPETYYNAYLSLKTEVREDA